MRILLLHSDDSPLAGPWVGQRWDAAFDLARSGWSACERWSAVLGCPVKPIDGIRDGLAEIHRVSELLRLGMGRLVDREGLDWWELTAILAHSQLEALVVLRKLATSLPAGAEVWITQEGFEAGALRQLLGARLRVIASAGAVPRAGFGHYFRRLRQLPVAQVLQILGDKYDAGYRVRRYLHRRPGRGARPVVLAPSSYINISLTAAAFARIAPEREFLLLSTRSSGRLDETPGNVRQAWLASYAGEGGADEYPEILERWEGLKKEIDEVPELAELRRLGLMDDFARRFADGLAIRDAWLRVLEREPVEAVLCCDDSNPYTHIPLLLARKRGMPTVACHHGALDGRYLIKTSHADVVLAKGRMEQDYLVNTCGVDPSVVEIGAPSAPAHLERWRAASGDCIVFFSEPYEMTTGRTAEIYRDILPGLADFAIRAGKALVVKLHPSENFRERQGLAQAVLTNAQAGAIQWLTGRFDPALVLRAWCGVTVQSSVAVECAVQGVPCFVCDWLDLWPYGYISHFRKFGVGIGLRTPADIARIPEMVADYRPSRQVAEDCWQVLPRERFEEILAGRKAASAVPLGVQGSG